MNAIQDELIGEKNLFQTWAPDREPAEDSVIFRWTFDRAILNNEAVEGILELDKYQGRNNVFFVGAYSKYGIPLLENGVKSAIDICERLGVSVDWKYNQSKDEEHNSNNFDYSLFLRFIIFIFMCYLFVSLVF